MPHPLAVNFNLPGGTRLVYGKFDLDDDTETATVPIELRTSNATNSLICRVISVVRNGTSTTLVRQTNPAQGLNIDDVTRYFIQGTRETPTGYTDMKAVERAAPNNKDARRTALEAHWASAGHIDGGPGGSLAAQV